MQWHTLWSATAEHRTTKMALECLWMPPASPDAGPQGNYCSLCCSASMSHIPFGKGPSAPKWCQSFVSSACLLLPKSGRIAADGWMMKHYFRQAKRQCHCIASNVWVLFENFYEVRQLGTFFSCVISYKSLVSEKVHSKIYYFQIYCIRKLTGNCYIFYKSSVFVSPEWREVIEFSLLIYEFVRTQITEFPSHNKFGCISEKMDTRKSWLRILILPFPPKPYHNGQKAGRKEGRMK